MKNVELENVLLTLIAVWVEGREGERVRKRTRVNKGEVKNSGILSKSTFLMSPHGLVESNGVL